MNGEFVPFEIQGEHSNSWNSVTFRGCKILNMKLQNYKAGQRMSIEICAPRLLKKFYLFTWNDSPVFNAIQKANLKKGDIISCCTVMNYYKSTNDDGMEVYQEAFQIVPNWDFVGDRESENYFRLMYIERAANERKSVSKYLTTSELLKKML